MKPSAAVSRENGGPQEIDEQQPQSKAPLDWYDIKKPKLAACLNKLCRYLQPILASEPRCLELRQPINILGKRGFLWLNIIWRRCMFFFKVMFMEISRTCANSSVYSGRWDRNTPSLIFCFWEITSIAENMEWRYVNFVCYYDKEKCWSRIFFFDPG